MSIVFTFYTVVKKYFKNVHPLHAYLCFDLITVVHRPLKSSALIALTLESIFLQQKFNISLLHLES